MSKTDNIIKLYEPSSKGNDSERDAYVQELQRLLACYQLASSDDKNVVWAVLNKYAPHINKKSPRHGAFLVVWENHYEK